jgi:Mg-chelatase subunit ChlD
VLLTDGMHNSPHFSSAQQAVPKLRENGVRVYALGVGDATEVDIPTLDDIATGTGGRSYAVGTDQPNEIEAALVEINAEVRGGLY